MDTNNHLISSFEIEDKKVSSKKKIKLYSKSKLKDKSEWKYFSIK